MTNVFTGGYAHSGEKSIICLEADTDSHAFREIFSNTDAECPSYVLRHPSHNILYAVRELTEEGALYAFRIKEDGLEKICELPSGGKDPCFLTLDETGKYLIVINYSGSSFSIYRLDGEGVPVQMTECVHHEGSGPNPARQEAAHPHCAVFYEGLLYVCDLGMDRIFVYELDSGTGRVTEKKRIEFPAGAGPRHMVFSEEHRDIAYVVGELGCCVCVFKVNKDGAELLQKISTLPDGFGGCNICAAIRFSADGKALFVSNRGHDSIVTFSIDEEGLLKRKGWCSTGGRTPRDFCVTGDYIIAANQDSGNITMLQYDPGDFSLKLLETEFKCIKPTCVAGGN